MVSERTEVQLTICLLYLILSLNPVLRKKATFAAFIDFKKANDFVDRSILLKKKLENIGVKGKMYNAILAIYKNVTCCFKVNGMLSEWFDVKLGLRQ